jgi:hypothetical protein
MSGAALDHAEPPKVVIEAPAVCADGGHTEEVLRRTLAPARAPSGAWTVWMRVSRMADGSLRGEGEVTDAAQAPVAHRDFFGDCAPLARAVGVWASLVLDQELTRVEASPEQPPGAEKRDDAPRAPPAHATAPPDVSVWPAPAPEEKPPPEASLVLKHDPDKRTLETGAATFLMGGTGTGALAGPSIFAFVELGGGVFFRGALAVGRTLEALKPATDVYGTIGISRFDACFRLPGLYLDRRGLQLDACGGADMGFLHFDAMSANQYGTQAGPVDARTIPFLALGPSLGMRGDLASDLAVEVRGVLGLNLIRESFTDPVAGTFVDPPIFGGRVELGLSWRWR